MTRYPLDIEITDDYDSTLDHYVSLFVVAIAAIILALLACTAYGRFITAKTRHDRVPSSEETKSLLWAINYAKQSITFVSLLSLPILSVQKGREFFKVNPSFRMKRSRHVIRILKQKVLIAKLKKKKETADLVYSKVVLIWPHSYKNLMSNIDIWLWNFYRYLSPRFFQVKDK